MGFLAPAVPWIIKGGVALGSSLLGRKAQSSAMQRSPEEQQALQGAQGAATSLQQGGQSLMRQGQGVVQQGLDTLSPAAGYWNTLLGGNRARMSQATAAPRASITDTYRGAERNLQRSGIRGAQRDLAKAELGRQRAGQIAGLTTGVQPMAAQQLGSLGLDIGQLGQSTTSTGAQLSQSAGNIWGNLLGQGAQNRQYGRQEGEKAGRGIGGFLFDLISGIGGGNKGIGRIPTGRVDDIPNIFGPGLPF